MSTQQRREDGPISKKQIQLIHVAVSQLGMDDETYRAMLRDRYHLGAEQPSCKQLSYREASDLIDHLKSVGAQITPSRKSRGRATRRPGDPPTPAQWEKIYAVAREITWRLPMQLALQGFARRMLGVAWPQTIREASDLIEHLKNMRATQKRRPKMTDEQIADQMAADGGHEPV